MPRRDWNTPSAHVQKPRHAAMHSAARGRGHDKHRRAAKHERHHRERKPRREEP